MALLNIVTWPAPVLDEPADPVTEFDGNLAKLVSNMFETMYTAPGVGLAAVQVGISKRLFVMDCSGGKDPAQSVALINPEVLRVEGNQNGEEGCLSFPGISHSRHQPRQLGPLSSRLSRPAQSTSREADDHGLRGRLTLLTLLEVVELVFLMLIMKLPILYLAGVCYWAIKAEPKPLEGAPLPAVPQPGPDAPPRSRPRRRGPHGGPRRREARAARDTRVGHSS